MPSNRTVAIYGAYGHTGRFIVAELVRKGLTPILSGRHLHKLNGVSEAHGGLEVRVATLDAPASHDQAIRGADAVINWVGPFAETTAPVIETALRARIPYLDIVAEPDIAATTFGGYADRARRVGIAVVPAVGFYGGLGDLLATAAMGDWSRADEITLGIFAQQLAPTPGTRNDQDGGRTQAGRRLVPPAVN